MGDEDLSLGGQTDPAPVALKGRDADLGFEDRQLNGDDLGGLTDRYPEGFPDLRSTVKGLVEQHGCAEVRSRLQGARLGHRATSMPQVEASREPLRG